MFKILLQFAKRILIRFFVYLAIVFLGVYISIVSCEHINYYNKSKMLANQNYMFLNFLEKQAHRDIRDILYEVTKDQQTPSSKRVFIPENISYIEWHEYNNLDNAKIIASDDWSLSPKIIADFEGNSIANQLTSNLTYACNFDCYILAFNSYILNNKTGYAISALKIRSLMPIFMAMRDSPSFIIDVNNTTNSNDWLDRKLSTEYFNNIVATNINNTNIVDIEQYRNMLPENATVRNLIELIQSENNYGIPVFLPLKYRNNLIAMEISYIPKIGLKTILSTAIKEHLILTASLSILLFITLLYSVFSIKSFSSFIKNNISRIRKFTNTRNTKAKSEIAILTSFLNSSLESNEEQERQIYKLKKKLSLYSNYDSNSGLPNIEWLNVQIGHLQSEYKIDNNINIFLIQMSTSIPDEVFLSEDTHQKFTKELANFIGGQNYLACLKPNLYGILTTDIVDITNVYTFLQNLKSHLKERFNDGKDVFIKAGILNIISSTISTNQLLKKVNIAYQNSKSSPDDDSFLLFNESMNQSLDIDYEFENNIRSAKNKGELFMKYDSICNIESNQIVGLEANCYWYNKNRLSKLDDYVDELARCGLLIDYGYWKIENALNDLSEIDQKANANLDIYIPLHNSQLLDPNLLSFLDVQIVRHHIMPSRIFFSITEETLSYDIMGCLGTISALNHNGYGIHLSGFNNGYLGHDFVEDNNISSVSINGRNTKRMLISEYDRHMLSKYITKCLALNKFKIICDGIDNIVTLQALKGCNITLMEGSLLPCDLTPLEVINILIKHQPVISK